MRCFIQTGVLASCISSAKSTAKCKAKASQSKGQRRDEEGHAIEVSLRSTSSNTEYDDDK